MKVGDLVQCAWTDTIGIIKRFRRGKDILVMWISGSDKRYRPGTATYRMIEEVMRLEVPNESR